MRSLIVLPLASQGDRRGEEGQLLFVGGGWAEAHHDVELMDATGRRLAKARLPEGVVGMARLHAMIAEQLGEDAEEAEVGVGIETERGPWVAALIAAGYTVYAINPLQVSRYRELKGPRTSQPRATRDQSGEDRECGDSAGEASGRRGVLPATSPRQTPPVDQH